MLFSNAHVAEFINRNFEPAWHNVRDVPVMTFDFGNGVIETRTFLGDTAFLLLDSKSRVLDVLPSTPTPRPFLDRLNEFVRLSAAMSQTNGMDFELRLFEYHESQLESLLKDGEPLQLVDSPPSDASAKLQFEPAVQHARPETPSPAAIKMNNWELMLEDNKTIEGRARRGIHKYFASSSKAVDLSTTRIWVFKNILSLDLEDKFLGQRENLFRDYPFAKEDAEARAQHSLTSKQTSR